MRFLRSLYAAYYSTRWAILQAEPSNSARQHVLPGRVAQHRVLVVPDRRRLAAAPAAGLHPGRPVLPPAAVVGGGAAQPLDGVRGRRVVGAVDAAAAGRIHDAGDVSGRAEHEPDVAAEQPAGGVAADPGRDVVLLGRDVVGVRLHLAE